MKRLATVAALSLATLTLAACGSSSSGESTTSTTPTDAPTSAAASSAAPESSAAAAVAPAGLMDASKFQVCAFVGFPPLEYKEQGSDEPTGFDIEAAQAVAESWGIQAEITDIGFDGLLPALQAKRCDAVWSGMFLNDERQQKADGAVYLKTGDALLVAKGNPAGITTEADLAGKRLAVAAGTTAVKTAEALSVKLEAEGLPAIQIQQYPTFPAEVGAVKAGKADAVLELDVALSDAVRTAPDDFELVPNVFPTVAELAVYTQKDSGLAADITTAWAALIESGKAAEIAERYDIPVENLTAG